MIKINKFFIFLTFLSLVFAYAVGGLFPFLIFYTLITILIVTSIYMSIISKSLHLNVVVEKGYYSAGDNIDCITQINSKVDLPIPYIETKNCNFADKDNACEEVISLTTDENAWLNRRISFYSRGIYDLGTISIKAYDIFRIVSFYKKEDLNIKLKVYPKLFDITKLPGGGKDVFINTMDKTVSNEDQFTIKDVRKYRNGDSLKRVHWKLSAKHNELYVKNSDTTSGEEISIFMDLSKDNYEYDPYRKAEEAVVDFSMSIINFMVQRETNMNMNIFMNSNKITSFQVRGKEEFNSFMELMVNVKSDGVMELGNFMQHQCYKLHKVNQIIAVIAKLSMSFTNSIIGLKSQGYNISVFFYLQDNECEMCQEILRKWGINCSNFTSIYKISEVEG